MILPEEIINTYTFEKQNEPLKTHLIHYYNDLTLKKYKEKGQFCSKEEIVETLPTQIIKWYNQEVKEKEKPKSNLWSDEEDEKFKTFLNKYEHTETATSKFKDFMTAFATENNLIIPVSWNNKYEILCDKHNIKYEKIVDPRYAHKGGSGTCYVNLRLKSIAESKDIDFKESRIPKIPKL